MTQLKVYHDLTTPKLHFYVFRIDLGVLMPIITGGYRFILIADNHLINFIDPSLPWRPLSRISCFFKFLLSWYCSPCVIPNNTPNSLPRLDWTIFSLQYLPQFRYTVTYCQKRCRVKCIRDPGRNFAQDGHLRSLTLTSVLIFRFFSLPHYILLSD